MPKDTKTLGNSKARACESLGFVHKKGCARVLTQPHSFIALCSPTKSSIKLRIFFGISYKYFLKLRFPIQKLF